MLVRAGSALGVAILMQDVTRTLLDALASNPVEDDPESVLRGVLRRLERVPGLRDTIVGLEQDHASGRTARLSAALSPQIPCPVCSSVHGREGEYLSTLLAHLGGPGALAEAYRASDGLCLSHFRRALARATSGANAAALVASQQVVWERLKGELGEFIRKSDHRSRGEPYGVEKDVWLRALEAISGPRPRSGSIRQGLTQSV
jgi:hypothetical protein